MRRWWLRRSSSSQLPYRCSIDGTSQLVELQPTKKKCVLNEEDAMDTQPAAEIPDQKGKTAVVTGANSGLGFHTALQLCRAGAHVVVTARDKGKGAAAIRRLRAEVPGADAEFGVLDLADLSSVRRFSAEILDRMRSLDVLVNNAGVMGVPQRLTTADGFELQFGTNHLGHFALTGLLLPALLARPGARVVTVSSLAHSQGRIRFDDIQGERVYDPWTAYAQSKLANLLFALELDRRARSHAVSLASVAAHPGVSATNLQTAGPRLGHSGFLTRGRLLLLRLIGQNAARGALPSVYAATAPEVVGGGFYGPAGPGQIRGDPIRVTPAPGALDQGVALRLWEISERLTAIRFHWSNHSVDAADGRV
jgi:NAD(P)-dependent dehydrogenase (short-subunit alcohol dehydrogenase family)